MALFWSSLLTFYTRRQNGLLHVTDKAATAGNFETTAAGSLSSSNFTSARRHRRLPSSDLKQVNYSVHVLIQEEYFSTCISHESRNFAAVNQNLLSIYVAIIILWDLV